MTDLRAADDVSTGELLNGRYRLEERIGEGGMARVYRAHDNHLNRTTAVKIMRGPVDGEDTLERARAETRVLASLSHHSLVTVFDARISEDDGCYIVMEYVDGITLKDRIHSGPLDERDAAGIAVDVAEALHVAHSAGIVHRDIKPSNVLLRRSPLPGRTWHAKLADFGIAYLLDTTRVTNPGLIVGTAAYIAPEQAQGQPPAPPADIYAFGLMLIEALTGRRPYADAEGIGAVMARLISQPEIPDTLRPEWQGLLRGMTARQPEDRPTAIEVATVAARLAAQASTPTVDQPTEAVAVDTGPTVALPIAGAAAAGVAAAAAARSSAASAAGSAADAAPADAETVAVDAVSPTAPVEPVTAVASEPTAATAPAASATMVKGEPADAPPRRRRGIVALATAAAIVAVALAAVVWGLGLAGATPDPEPTAPLVEQSVAPSQAPTQQAPPVVTDDSGGDGTGGNQGEGNQGNQGNGDPGNRGNRGNQGNGDPGNQGNQGNQGNGNSGNQGTGNGNETGTETDTGTQDGGDDTGTDAPETPAPSPTAEAGTTDGTAVVVGNGNGNGQGTGNQGRGKG